MSQPPYRQPPSKTIPRICVTFGDNSTAYKNLPLELDEYLHGCNYSPDDIISIHWGPHAKKVAKILSISPRDNNDNENYDIEAGWFDPDTNQNCKVVVEPQHISLIHPNALVIGPGELRFTPYTKVIHREECNSVYSDKGRHLDGSWDWHSPLTGHRKEIRDIICVCDICDISLSSESEEDKSPLPQAKGNLKFLEVSMRMSICYIYIDSNNFVVCAQVD